MKRILLGGFRLLFLSVILVACGGGGATQVPATQAPATEPPVPAASQAPGTGPATLVAIDLAGPPMAVGSQYLYVDGEVIVAVPGGTYQKGDINIIDNQPSSPTEPDFWIYNSEVTNRQYQLCVAIGLCTDPDPTDNPNYNDVRFMNNPVVGVNWQQSQDYCAAMNAQLPTEKQWEKAARGIDGNKFEWGNKPDPACNLLNFNYCVGHAQDIQTYPDGVSYYGLFDMAGNVREWTADWYDPGFPDVPPALGEKRSIRSSSFADGGDFAVAAHRYSLKPDAHLPDLGFRCVVHDPTYFAPLCQQLGFLGSGPNGAESDCVPDFKCNKVSIAQGEYCAGGMVPHTVVTFSLSNTPPTGWTTKVPGCTGGINPGDAQDCTSPGPYTATAEGSCDPATTCDPVCPVHYNMVNGQCVWDGTGSIGTRCVAGLTYDPVNQCCAATPGSGINFDLCPAGYHPLNGACIKDPLAQKDTALQSVHFKTCGPGDQPCDPAKDPTCVPGGGSCPARTCPGGQNWDGGACCCKDTAGICH